MQATALPFVKPVASAERPYALRYRIDGVRAELNFTSDDARAAKAAELVNSGGTVVFLPSQSYSAAQICASHQSFKFGLLIKYLSMHELWLLAIQIAALAAQVESETKASQLARQQ